MYQDPKLTEERLRSWLDGNQPARERLSVQILSLDNRFADVRPRQPKGGRDGGFDLEARFEGTGRAVGAIGFRNSPSDNDVDQRWVRTKFGKDLDRTIETAGHFEVFVFITNVRLTVGGRSKLLGLAKKRGSFKVELYDREQMRLVLDSPDGLAARYQFLQIPLSEAEQATFFSRWGADIERIVTTSFAAVEDRLRRLEFLHEKDNILETLAFRIDLSEPTRIADLPHVRAFVAISKITRDIERSSWHVGVCNNTAARSWQGCGPRHCLAAAFWLHDVTRLYATSASTWHDPFATLGASGGFNDFVDAATVARLKDIDDAFFAFFMNRSLSQKVERISLYANQYLIWTADKSLLRMDEPNVDPTMPWTLSDQELSDPWVRVMWVHGTPTIHFSDKTPRRMWDARQLEQPSK